MAPFSAIALAPFWMIISTSAFNMQSGTVSAVLGGSVGLNKSTSGTVTLSGVNAYTGATNVSAGTLSLSSTGSIASGSATTVGSGATLTGSGTVNGALTVSSGGMVAGNLTLKGATTFADQGIYVASLTTVGGVGGTSAAPTGTAGQSSQLNLTGASSLTISDGFKLSVTGSPVTFTQPGIYNWLVMAVSNVGALNWDGVQIGTVSFGSPSDFSVFAVDNSSGADYIGVSYSYSAVPEATTLLLGFAGLTPVLLQRRSHRRFRRSALAV